MPGWYLYGRVLLAGRWRRMLWAVWPCGLRGRMGVGCGGHRGGARWWLGLLDDVQGIGAWVLEAGEGVVGPGDGHGIDGGGRTQANELFVVHR